MIVQQMDQELQCDRELAISALADATLFTRLLRKRTDITNCVQGGYRKCPGKCLVPTLHLRSISSSWS